MRNSEHLTRRRVLTICAGVGVAAMLGPQAGNARLPQFEWRGRALGGPAYMAIRHRDGAMARKLIGYCVGEIERLERTFSLYRDGSEISLLNRDGRLDDPSHDFRLLLGDARHYGSLSGGAFDVTIQPLWESYSRHFSGHLAAATGPDPQEISRASTLVDYRGIDLDNGKVALARRGMAVTLNGMAQGYITDRIANMLRDAGLDDVLVDLGEIRALDGGAWKVGIANPGQPGKIIAELSVSGCAVATSSGAGSRFEPSGRFHHLLDPLTGQSADGCLSATVLARTAVTADALATAIAVSPMDRAEQLLRAFGGYRAILVAPDRSVVDIST